MDFSLKSFFSFRITFHVHPLREERLRVLKLFELFIHFKFLSKCETNFALRERPWVDHGSEAPNPPTVTPPFGFR